MLHPDLAEKALRVGEQLLQKNFTAFYGDLFNKERPDLSQLGKPEVCDPMVIEHKGQVCGFVLPATLLSREAVRDRAKGAPNEIKEYIDGLSPSAVGTSLASWVDPSLPLVTQKKVARALQAHMEAVFAKSPAEIILCAPMNFNPRGFGLGAVLDDAQGYMALAPGDDHFYEHIQDNPVLKALPLYGQMRVHGRYMPSLKGVSFAARQKVGGFAQRYGLAQQISDQQTARVQI